MIMVCHHCCALLHFSYMSIVESQPTYGIHYYEVKVCTILSAFSDLITTKLVAVYFTGILLWLWMWFVVFAAWIILCYI